MQMTCCILITAQRQTCMVLWVIILVSVTVMQDLLPYNLAKKENNQRTELDQKVVDNFNNGGNTISKAVNIGRKCAC